ncbi:hypothetical protein EDC17_10661, partial [Sphingobacterium alimentarium]
SIRSRLLIDKFMQANVEPKKRYLNMYLIGRIRLGDLRRLP